MFSFTQSNSIEVVEEEESTSWEGSEEVLIIRKNLFLDWVRGNEGEKEEMSFSVVTFHVHDPC